MRDTVDGIAPLLFKYKVFNRLDALTYLVDHGQTIVDQTVDNAVEDIDSVMGKNSLPRLTVALTGVEQLIQRLQVAGVINGDDIACPDKDIYLGGDNRLFLIIPEREVEHQKHMIPYSSTLGRDWRLSISSRFKG